MPFVYGNKEDKKIKKDTSLQVQKSRKKDHKERASLCSCQKASLTLEAALVLPPFVLILLSLLYFFVIMDIHMNLQIKLEEGARKIAKEEYLTQDITGYSYFSLKNTLFDKKFEQYLNKTAIAGGAEGISLIHSSFFSNRGVIDIVIDYRIKIPLISEKWRDFSFVQRCRFKTWIGNSLTQDALENQEVVYITETGSVYHTNRNCTHLNLSIKKCSINDLENLRNENGGIYHICELCGKKAEEEAGTVYITDSGIKWHSELSCSGLKRNIIEISISEIGTRQICRRCKGE